MSANNFVACVDFTLHQEDQTDTGIFEDDPRDPGGATRWGVTQGALSDWLGRPATEDEVRNLSRDTACLIARRKYWQPVRGDDLPRGVDLMTFDMAYNAGTGRSAKLLQEAVGAAQDGAIGPATLRAVAGYPAAHLVSMLADAQTEYYRSLPGFATYGNGWLNRVNARKVAALRMG